MDGTVPAYPSRGGAVNVCGICTGFGQVCGRALQEVRF